MSTYSNDPKQSMWETWFVASVIMFLSIIFWGTYYNNEQLPIYYDALLLTTFVNLIYCLYIGLKK